MGTEAVQALPTGLCSPSPGSAAPLPALVGRPSAPLPATFSLPFRPHMGFSLFREQAVRQVSSQRSARVSEAEAGRGESHQGVLSPL